MRQCRTSLLSDTFSGQLTNLQLHAMVATMGRTTSFFLCGLLLPLITLTGISSSWSDDAPPPPPDKNIFQLRPVHPKSAELVQKKAKVEGYQRMEFTYTDSKGKTKTETLIVCNAPIITGQDVATASIDETSPCLNITLTDQGAEALSHVTKAMRFGQDRIALIYNNSIIMAPVVQTPLSRSFTIPGTINVNIHQLLRTLHAPSATDAQTPADGGKAKPSKETAPSP